MDGVSVSFHGAAIRALGRLYGDRCVEVEAFNDLIQGLAQAEAAYLRLPKESAVETVDKTLAAIDRAASVSRSATWHYQ